MLDKRAKSPITLVTLDLVWIRYEAGSSPAGKDLLGSKYAIVRAALELILTDAFNAELLH
jgi:hypothetical protein